LREKMGAEGRRLAEKRFARSRLLDEVPLIYELAVQAGA